MFSKFIHTIACISTLFFWLNNVPLHGYTTPYLSIHQFDRHLGCFELLVVMTNAMNIHVEDLHGHMFSILLGLYLRVEFLHHMASLWLAFWGTACVFYQEIAPFVIPTNTVSGSQFLHILTSTCCCYYYYSHSNWREVVSQCGFFFLIVVFICFSFLLIHFVCI